MYQIFKKLVLVLVTFMQVTKVNIKNQVLIKMLYIYYLLYFKKNSNQVKALLNLISKIKLIIFTYTSKLSV